MKSLLKLYFDVLSNIDVLVMLDTLTKSFLVTTHDKIRVSELIIYHLTNLISLFIAKEVINKIKGAKIQKKK